MSDAGDGRRYVILHHTGVAEPHYDLMWELSPDGLLRTFRCPCWPAKAGDRLVSLPDHRRAYLDYEGPVSGGRGQVARVEHGRCRVEAAPGQLKLELAGATLRLSADPDGTWLVV